MLAAVTTALLAVVAQSAVAASTMKFTGFEFGSVDVKIAAIPAAALFCLTSRPDLGTLICLPNEVINFRNYLFRGLAWTSIIFVPKNKF